MVIFVLCIAIVGHAAAALFYSATSMDEQTRGLVYFGSKIVVNAIPLVWVLGVEKRRLSWKRPSNAAVTAGVVSGLVIGGALLIVYYAVLRGWVAPGGRIAGGALADRVGAFGAVEHFALFAVFLCVVNSGLEEYYWRWFVFGQVRRLTGFVPAMLVSAAGFTLHHIVVLATYFPDVWLVVIMNAGVFAGGCVWAWVYERYRYIAAAWISHGLVDAAIMVAAYELLFGSA